MKKLNIALVAIALILWAAGVLGCATPEAFVGRPELDMWIGLGLMLAAIFLLKALSEYRRDRG